MPLRKYDLKLLTQSLESADDRTTFNYRLDKTKLLYTSTAPTFDQYFTNRIRPILTTNFNTISDHPWTSSNANWTNNNCESLNAVLKHAVDWKSQSLTSLVEKLHKIVKSQYNDLKRALVGQGHLKLCKPYEKFFIPIDTWNQLQAHVFSSQF